MAENTEKIKKDQFIKSPKKKQNEIQKGIKLKWCMGFNYDLVNSVINLTTIKKKEIFYVSGHNGILYNYKTNKQKIFQGHSNQITALIHNEAKNIIVTADRGEACMMIIWSDQSGIPLRTFFDPDQEGIKSIDISKDGKLILTLSFEKNQSQRVKVWDWENYNEENPIINQSTIEVNQNESFEFIKWNYSNQFEFVTTGKKVMRFWKRENQSFVHYSPFVIKKEEKKKENQREFSQTVFIPLNEGSQAVTGTLDGNLIVWDVILILEELANLNNRREIKSINLLNNSTQKYNKHPGISLLDIYNNEIIVIGTTVGTVRFYDFQFRIIFWFEDLQLEKITSLSFSKVKNEIPLPENFLDNKSSQQEFPEDFIVCDTGARISLLGIELFRQIEPQKRKGTLILQSIQQKILWMSIDEKSEKVALSCDNGTVFEWKIYSQTLNLLKNFQGESNSKEVGNCIEFSPDGDYLIIATNQGNIYIKKKKKKEEDSETFNNAPLQISQKKKGIQCERLVFSKCSNYFAVSDDHKCVSIFNLGYKYGDKTQPIEWVFKGKIRAHTLSITDLCFSDFPNPETNTPFLYSIGKDMYLVQYQISKNENNDTEKEIQVKKCEKIEANEEPTACMMYPEEYFDQQSVLVVNSMYKLKVWGFLEEMICRYTALGPCFGGKISQLISLYPPKNTATKNKFIVFQTENKILGIIKLPLNGNPNNSIGILSNPGKINHICVSRNKKYILTAGDEDLTLNIWRVNYQRLEENQLFNLDTENPLDIYPDLLEGGENGNLYRDLKDFFYYSQIRKKEENTTKAHKLDGKIPLKEIPNLMIALGHYPSNREIKNMISEKSLWFNKGIYNGNIVASFS